MLQKDSPRLIHVADPMCSWCYAFGPELERIRNETALPVDVVAGGLFVGDRTLVLDDELRAYLRDTWSKVQRMSGRPVSYNLIDWTAWTYDTELSNRALVAMRDHDREQTLDFFDRLQEAFYAQNLDLTNADVLSELAGRDLRLDDPALAKKTTDDFEIAIELGAVGFPTLILDTGAEKITVGAGYVKADQVLRTIGVFLPN